MLTLITFIYSENDAQYVENHKNSRQCWGEITSWQCNPAGLQAVYAPVNKSQPLSKYSACLTEVLTHRLSSSSCFFFNYINTCCPVLSLNLSADGMV